MHKLIFLHLYSFGIPIKMCTILCATFVLAGSFTGFGFLLQSLNEAFNIIFNCVSFQAFPKSTGTFFSYKDLDCVKSSTQVVTPGQKHTVEEILSACSAIPFYFSASIISVSSHVFVSLSPRSSLSVSYKPIRMSHREGINLLCPHLAS